MNNSIVGRLKTPLLILILFALPRLALAQNQEKNKPQNPPPYQAPQASRPAPQQHTPTTQMSHTGNRAPSATVNRGKGTPNPTTGKSAPGGPGTASKSPSPSVTHSAETRKVPAHEANAPSTVGPGASGPPPKGPVSGSRSHQPPRNERVVGDKRVAFDPGGHPRDIHAQGMNVHRTVNRQRTFVAQHNGRQIVGLGPNRGYVQRAYPARNGHAYVQRTYVVGGSSYASVYRSYPWHGATYYHYVPAYYYHPAVYGWAYNPWPAPVHWAWGWGSAPWYASYGYYFAPYPVYPSPALWLTDYVLAESLKAAYADQPSAATGAVGDAAGAAPSPANSDQLSPAIKQMIADEVQRQLAAERDAAAAQTSQSMATPSATPATPAGAQPTEAPAALDPDSRVFIVANTLDVVKDDGTECSLTAGDVIMRTGDVPDGSKVAVKVITSKHSDCASNANTAIDVADLEEMQNQFRQQMDAGLQALVDGQGKNGMPASPDTATISGEGPQPVPDSSAGTDLTQQQKNADQIETDVQKAPAPPGN